MTLPFETWECSRHEVIDMNALWTFEGDHLVARNQAGTMMWAWLADEATGRPLADLLNHSQSLSRLLFSPWTVRQPTSTSTAYGTLQSEF